jgi:hypothetical protein
MALADREQYRFGRFGMDVAALGSFAQHIQKGFVVGIAKCDDVGWFVCHGGTSRDLSKSASCSLVCLLAFSNPSQSLYTATQRAHKQVSSAV